jgi:hypothetical protein
MRPLSRLAREPKGDRPTNPDRADRAGVLAVADRVHDPADLYGVGKFRHVLHIASDGATVEAARLGGGSGQN